MTVQEFAKSKGFDFAEDTGKTWNGYRVYNLGFNTRHYIGYPTFALVKNHQVRMNAPIESLKILSEVYPPKRYDVDDE